MTNSTNEQAARAAEEIAALLRVDGPREPIITLIEKYFPLHDTNYRAEQLAYECISDLHKLLPLSSMDGRIKTIRERLQKRFVEELSHFPSSPPLSVAPMTMSERDFKLLVASICEDEDERKRLLAYWISQVKPESALSVAIERVRVMEAKYEHEGLGNLACAAREIITELQQLQGEGGPVHYLCHRCGVRQHADGICAIERIINQQETEEP